MSLTDPGRTRGVRTAVEARLGHPSGAAARRVEPETGQRRERRPADMREGGGPGGPPPFKRAVPGLSGRVAFRREVHDGGLRRPRAVLRVAGGHGRRGRSGYH